MFFAAFFYTSEINTYAIAGSLTDVQVFALSVGNTVDESVLMSIAATPSVKNNTYFVAASYDVLNSSSMIDGVLNRICLFHRMYLGKLIFHWELPSLDMWASKAQHSVPVSLMLPWRRNVFPKTYEICAISLLDDICVVNFSLIVDNFRDFKRSRPHIVDKLHCLWI